MRRDFIFWGLVLILLGGLLLLNAAGIPLPGGIHPMQLFWPSTLILLGLWIILGVFWRGGSPESDRRAVELQGAREAALRLNYGAGRLKLSAGATAGQFLTGTFAGNVEENVNLVGDRLDVRLEMNPFPFFPFVGSSGSEWELQVNREVPLSMRVEMGAAQSEFDLRDLRVTDLKLNTGASKTVLTLPAKAGTVSVDVELGAASLDVLVPQGVAGRIRVEQGVTAIDVDTQRFPYANGMYESGDYSVAQDRVDIRVQAGAGRVSVR